jgi:membrane protein DedA with SNARE-associated domain
MHSRLNLFTYWFLIILSIVGAAIWISMPYLVPFLFGAYGETSKESVSMIVISLMAAGVPAILILLGLVRIMRTVIRDDCFVEANVRSLRRMGIYAFLITGIMLVRIVLYNTLSVMLIAVVFFTAGLFCQVLASVFERAVAYKLDDDMTI